MDQGLIMFGLFILILGILIPIIQQINSSRQESFENSADKLEQLQDLTETFWEAKKAEKKAEATQKAVTKKVEANAKNATTQADVTKRKQSQLKAQKKEQKLHKLLIKFLKNL